MKHLCLSVSMLLGYRTKSSVAAYLEAAVLAFALENGCGQLLRLWYGSTGRKSLDKL